MPQEIWTAVDNYYTNLLEETDPVLEAALAASAQAGLPAINVSPSQGKFLQLLARAVGAKSILEVGTLGGYSTIWLARALPAGGRLVTLEIDPDHANVARNNIERAGLAHVVDLRLGEATESLSELLREEAGPFDFIFIDADKEFYGHYLLWALELARKGTVIIADNVVRKGDVLDANSKDEKVQGILRFNQVLASDSRVSATVMQTVGSKGYDGFAVALVTGEPGKWVCVK